MKKSDLTCPECGAGFRRIELTIMAAASAAPNDENRLGRL